MEFRQWLEMKFLEWQRNEGGRKTVAQFAEYLGVSQQTVSSWWNSPKVPQGDNVRKLADKFGLEVYDVLGIERPDRDLFYLQSIWDELSPEDRRKWIENMPKRITELGLPVHIPYGYRKPIGHETDRKAVPEQDPTIVPHLIKIKDMLLEGHSTTQLADYLSKSLLSPPRGVQWHSQTIRDILRNPFYTGIVRIGVSRVYLDPATATRKRDRAIPPDKIQSAPGKHIPLWDEATLHAINVELKRRTKNYRGRKNNQFTGLVRCGICGAPVWRQGNGPRAYRLIWRCSKCTTAIPHAILLQKVGDTLSSKLPSVGVTHSHPAPPSDSWELKLKDLRTRQDRLEDAYLAGQWDLDRYTKRKAELDYQIRDALDEITNAERQKAERRWWTESITTLGKQNDIAHWLSHTDPNEVNRALRILLAQITIFTDTIELVFI